MFKKTTLHQLITQQPAAAPLFRYASGKQKPKFNHSTNRQQPNDH